jgi:hypothetical protein
MRSTAETGSAGIYYSALQHSYGGLMEAGLEGLQGTLHNSFMESSVQPETEIERKQAPAGLVWCDSDRGYSRGLLEGVTAVTQHQAAAAAPQLETATVVF